MHKIIDEFREKYGEHLEMYVNPDEKLLMILANEVSKLRFQNSYMEDRLKFLEVKS